jgi:hypothetical protein
MMFNIYLFQALELQIFYHGETAKRIDRWNTLNEILATSSLFKRNIIC